MITSRTNDQVKRYRGLVSNPVPGLVCLEGHRLIADCISSGAVIRDFFVCPRGRNIASARHLIQSATFSGTNLWEVTDDIMDFMCDTDHPQGMAAVAVWDMGTEISADKPIVALDGIQDPGNVGTIMRSAAAFGFGSVMIGGNSARAYSPKVVRASMGALYRINVLHVGNLGGSLEGLKDCGIRILALDMSGSALSRTHDGPFCLVVGSEGSGLSKSVREAADEIVSIPMAPGIESLNASVAASVAMWELSGRTTGFDH